jgi:predicted nucleic acid-binding protein
MTAGHAAAVRFGEAIRVHPLVDWVVVDSELWSAAWDIFTRYDDKRFSFTDCTSFAVMHLRSLRDVLGVDRHFQQMGFRLLPGATSIA